jgi:pilus assembly protein CpaB
VRTVKAKTIILMVVAIGCGLVASYMTSKLIADRNANQQPPEEKVTVAVAKKNVNKWVLIKKPEDLFEMREFPKASAPDDAIFELKELQDKRPRDNVAAGLPVTRKNLMSKDLDGLAMMINPGSRAVAIKVNAEALVGGFVLPDSKVDIVCTQTRGDLVSSVILENMTVLAVDTIYNRDPEKGNTIIGTTVTLAAIPEEATRLSLAQAIGELRLVLRSPADQVAMDRHPVTRPQDLFKPLKARHDEEGDDNPAAPAGSSTSNTLPPVAPPPVEATDVKPEIRPDVKPDVKPEVRPAVDPTPDSPAPPAVKVHRVHIIEGDYQRDEVFFWDDAEKTWKKSTSAGVDEGPRRDPPSKSEAPRTEPEAPKGSLDKRARN